MPEYTISLLFWVLPLLLIGVFLSRKKRLGRIQKKAIAINLVILAGVGWFLDLAFAKLFFIFPNLAMTLRINIRQIPIEEFLFYLFGFWFIVLFYAFNDEYFLRKYNKDDHVYSKFARRINSLLAFYFSRRTLALIAVSLIGFTLLKQWLNPGKTILPGYIIFLMLFAYLPFIMFWRITRKFVNIRAIILVVTVTTLISIIWEVTLALPRGYWDYNRDYMIGIFIPIWHNLPVEAVTVWVFSSLIILSYEYTKIYLHRKAHQKIKVNGYKRTTIDKNVSLEQTNIGFKDEYKE